MTEYPWSITINKALVLGFIVTIDEENRINYTPILSEDTNLDREDHHIFNKNRIIKGIVNTPFPTYAISCYIPKSNLIEDIYDLGYEYPGTDKKDWFSKIERIILKNIKETSDEEALDYLNKSLELCITERKRHEPYEKVVCDNHEELIY